MRVVIACECVRGQMKQFEQVCIGVCVCVCEEDGGMLEERIFFLMAVGETFRRNVVIVGQLLATHHHHHHLQRQQQHQQQQQLHDAHHHRQPQCRCRVLLLLLLLRKKWSFSPPKLDKLLLPAQTLFYLCVPVADHTLYYKAHYYSTALVWGSSDPPGEGASLSEVDIHQREVPGRALWLYM